MAGLGSGAGFNPATNPARQEVARMSKVVAGSVIPSVVDSGTWSACFGLSWTDLMLHDMSSSNRIIRPNGTYIRNIAGTMGVAAARSQIVENFLTKDAEWLFMVDSDMGFDGDTIDRMVDSATANNVGILGALCFCQKRDTDLAEAPFYGQRFRIQPTLYTYVEVEETGERGFRSLTKYARDSFQTVAGTGAACLLMHRDVLLAVGPDPFAPITSLTAGGNGTPRTFSEDLSFCIRAAAVNLPIGVDTSIKTTHHKGGIFLDEAAFAMQQETLIQAKGHEVSALAQASMRGGA